MEVSSDVPIGRGEEAGSERDHLAGFVERLDLNDAVLESLHKGAVVVFRR